MSDAVEKTAAGATRGLLGSFAFILLMVGVEGVTGAVDLNAASSTVLLVLGALCAYAAFFWESAKKALSAEAQGAIGAVAQSRATWFALIVLILLAIILSPFVEDRRWPFLRAPYIIHIPIFQDTLEPSIPIGASKEAIKGLNTDVANILALTTGDAANIANDLRKFLTAQSPSSTCSLNSANLSNLIDRTIAADKLLISILASDPMNAALVSVYLNDETPASMYSFDITAEAMKQFRDELAKAGSRPCEGEIGKNWNLVRAYAVLNGQALIYDRWLRLLRGRMLKLQNELRNAH